MGKKIYITEFDIKSDIDAYFKKCNDNETMVGFDGLANALGMSRPTLMRYADGEFSEVVQAALQEIRARWEPLLLSKAASGVAFWLKNNAEYRDKVEHDMTSSDGSVGSDISPAMQVAIEQALKNLFM